MKSIKLFILLFIMLIIMSFYALAEDTCIMRFREGSDPSILTKEDVIIECSKTGSNPPFLDLTSVRDAQIDGKKGIKIRFTLDGETEHDIFIRKVSNDSIITDVNGEGRKTGLGETDRVDLDGDGRGDVGVTLEKIEDGTAFITLSRIERTVSGTKPPAKPALEFPEEKIKISPFYGVLAVMISLLVAYILIKVKRKISSQKVSEVIGENAIYQNIFYITAHLEKLENRIAGSMYLMALGFLMFFKATGLHIMLLASVLSFGFATSLIFRRSLDIRFGGMSTFALILYYSLGNMWIFLHFLAVVFICLPIGIFFMRRGYLGQMLFYVLSLVVFPVTILSYYFVIKIIAPFSFMPENVLYHAGDIIYLIIPQIYVYSILQLEKKKIVEDVAYFTGLLAISTALWVGIIFIIV